MDNFDATLVETTCQTFQPRQKKLGDNSSQTTWRGGGGSGGGVRREGGGGSEHKQVYVRASASVTLVGILTQTCRV